MRECKSDVWTLVNVNSLLFCGSFLPLAGVFGPHATYLFPSDLGSLVFH